MISMAGEKAREENSTPLVVINVVGLTPGLLGEHTPHLNTLVSDGFMRPLESVFPAVTTTAQATMLTGKLPSEHGIVGNGWYFRDRCEVRFWLQPNHLIQGEKVWHHAREQTPGFTCAQMFWWYNMYADVDWSVTPRPIYPADGRKIPDLYSRPVGLHESIEQKHGKFPFFDFWGPKSGIPSSRWIAKAAEEVFKQHRPNLTLVYLPHLDYNMQRLGPGDPAIWQDVAAIDKVVGELIAAVQAEGADILVLSEYGIEDVHQCIHINRILRQAGYLEIREELGLEMLDPGASRAFAVADHQIAHVYVRRAQDLDTVTKLLQQTPGIEVVLDREEQKAWGVNHERSGELVVIAEKGHWFSYYYWLDDDRAPDFARTVDIHRKPGYDPVELFIDPSLKIPQLKAARRLLQKKLGFRMLMDLIPLDTSLVKGSHGRLMGRVEDGPLVIGSRADLARDSFKMTDIHDLILQHFNPSA